MKFSEMGATMTPTMEEVAGWLRAAGNRLRIFAEGINEMSQGQEYKSQQLNFAELCFDRAAQVEAMAKFQLDAVTHLVEIGKDCESYGWELDQVLWCTNRHSITVRKLLSLEGLQKAEAMTCSAQVEAMGWRPIDEAPKNERVLLWAEGWYAPNTGEWAKNGFAPDGYCEWAHQPTHFRPNVEPPVTP